jgi:hypothetical protein
MYLAEKDESGNSDDRPGEHKSDGKFGRSKSDFQSYADALWWGVVSLIFCSNFIRLSAKIKFSQEFQNNF